MRLAERAGRSPENKATVYREQILDLLDKVDNDDLIFLRQIFTMIKAHIANRSERKGTHHEE